jgi:SAM-dependent methyltransferase
MRTFDAGCGNGSFSIYAAHRGNEVVAASFSSREQEDARRRAAIVGVSGIDFRMLDLRELERHKASLGHFDQVICLETIEHLLDDEALVAALADMLAPGGRLLLTTPFDRHHPLLGEQRDPDTNEDGSHVRFGYSAERLRAIVADAGLEVVSEDYVSGIVSQWLTNLMRRLTLRLGTPTGWALMLALRPLVVLDAPFTRILGYPHLSIALCATKP